MSKHGKEYFKHLKTMHDFTTQVLIHSLFICWNVFVYNFPLVKVIQDRKRMIDLEFDSRTKETPDEDSQLGLSNFCLTMFID